MGTMFDIVVYHPSQADGARAAERAMREIERLDRVLSHFKDDSDLSRLNREASRGFVAVDASLYDIVEQSIAWSRRTGGTFDITIAPLLRTWKQAYADGRRPSDDRDRGGKAVRRLGQDRSWKRRTRSTSDRRVSRSISAESAKATPSIARWIC